MTHPRLNYRWRCVTPCAPFAPRDGAGALVFDDRMWLLGGWNPLDKVHFPKICNSEVWTTADGAVWELVTPEAGWEGRNRLIKPVFPTADLVVMLGA